jgi:hypothetical protein
MKNRKKIVHPYDARFEVFEEGKYWFKCLRCADPHVYEPSEIPKHLLEMHKIPIKKQRILGWESRFRREYLEKRNEPIIYPPDDGIIVDTTPPKKRKKEEEEKKERQRKEKQADREK